MKMHVLIAHRVSFISLIWKMKLAEVLMKSCAPLGAGITLIALISGAIWGKPTWGTYWIWDARLTSFLILFLREAQLIQRI